MDRQSGWIYLHLKVYVAQVGTEVRSNYTWVLHSTLLLFRWRFTDEYYHDYCDYYLNFWHHYNSINWSQCISTNMYNNHCKYYLTAWFFSMKFSTKNWVPLQFVGLQFSNDFKIFCDAFQTRKDTRSREGVWNVGEFPGTSSEIMKAILFICEMRLL